MVLNNTRSSHKRSRKPPTTMSSTLSPTDFDSLEIQGQYSDINNRWDLPDSDWDNDSSSARLFERSRIKALAGWLVTYSYQCFYSKEKTEDVGY
ncbi:Spectrin beta chain, brain 2 [Fukomys damarensis]|uniref:Spectrin beta chain, brain 2 n=1 Tax=Fukomys damarensis TaxID=885580 RepID=A0A091DBA7_FUKDA|nr:Spectrin beta chain, brain 2 [Fukomys damarensis]